MSSEHAEQFEHEPNAPQECDADVGASAATENPTDIPAENHCEAAAVDEPVGAQRRAAGRVKVQGVRVGKGVVLDASAGGMRIKGKTPKGCTPGNVLDLEVTGDDESIGVKGEVRWIQRHPFRGATFGIAFVELSDQKRSTLFRIIRRAGAEARCRWMAA